MHEGEAFTNQIQTKWMCYNCFVLWCVSGSNVPLACVWHEERFYTAGLVSWNGAKFLADGKPWVSMLLIQYGLTMPTCLTFLAFEFFTNVLLMLLTSWLLALLVHESTICIMANHTCICSFAAIVC